LGLPRRSRSRSRRSGALDRLVGEDAERERRQVAFMDASGSIGVHTGALCIAEAGHRAGDGVVAQANMMARATVWDAMVDAFASATGDLAARMLAALDAGEREQGDVRGRQSAAILIVSGDRHGEVWRDRAFELRVEDHLDPVVELRRLVELRLAYDRLDEAEHAMAAGDRERAAAIYAEASAALGENPEGWFWAGVTMAGAGDIEGARDALARAFAMHDGWRALLERLPAAGLMPDDPTLMGRLLA